MTPTAQLILTALSIIPELRRSQLVGIVTAALSTVDSPVSPKDAASIVTAALVDLGDRVLLSGDVARLATSADEPRPIVASGVSWLPGCTGCAEREARVGELERENEEMRKGIAAVMGKARGGEGR